MSTGRKHRLVDCNPQFVSNGKGTITRRICFDCPEGHENCIVSIPFTPALDGTPQSSDQTNGAQWGRVGEDFATITFSPSIRNIPRWPDKATALAAGAIEEYLDESSFCALHIFIRDGNIEFCGDSK